MNPSIKLIRDNYKLRGFLMACKDCKERKVKGEFLRLVKQVKIRNLETKKRKKILRASFLDFSTLNIQKNIREFLSRKFNWRDINKMFNCPYFKLVLYFLLFSCLEKGTFLLRYNP